MHLSTLLLTFLGFTLYSHAAPRLGEPAPDVALTLTGNEAARLSDYKGQWVVLYFYPKADTPGCTKQACSLRDDYAALQKLNAIVLGASLDKLAAQEKFKAKYELPFPLIADHNKNLATAFDVLKLGGLMTGRKTFIINPEGKIAYIFDKVKTSSHYDEVAAQLKLLQDES